MNQSENSHIKTKTFSLDLIPEGSDLDMKSERVSRRLPSGITSSMLYQDILRIALPALWS